MTDRRSFLRLLGVSAVAAGGITEGQETHGDTPKRRTFKGTSKKGDIDDALQKAIASAERSVRHPDAMVTWTLKGVTGRSGGIAGFRDVTVTIEADVS